MLLLHMNNLNVMIIEDEFLIRKHIKNTLVSFGFKNIYEASNAASALEIAEMNKIDLLFSDIKIDGEVDGIEISSTIKEKHNSFLIFITAYKDKMLYDRISKIEILGYLLKPYRPDELEVLVNLAVAKLKRLNLKKQLIYNDYRFCSVDEKLYLKDKLIVLSEKETLFFNLIFSNLNNIVLYDTLDKTVWTNNYVSDNTRRTFIYRIRKKFTNLNLTIEKNLGIKLKL